MQRVLKNHEVLFVVDEVITGFGRTGRMWGAETFGLEPDIMTCAKALSAGVLPISALLMSQQVYEAMRYQSEQLGNYAHGHTYAGHPVCAAVALETLKIYEDMNIPEHCTNLGRTLQDVLAPLEDHPLVGAIDMTGFMAGVELTEDKSSRRPFPDESKVPQRIALAARRHGLIIKSIGSRICLAPAYVISEDEMNEAGDRLKRALDDVHSELRAS